MTLQLPDQQVVTERVTELEGQDPLSAFDQLSLCCQREIGGPDQSPIVESPMPTIRTQQGRRTHLVPLTLLGAFVVGAFVGLPLALFVHGLTGRPLIAAVTALLVLTLLVGGVIRGLRDDDAQVAIARIADWRPRRNDDDGRGDPRDGGSSAFACRSHGSGFAGRRHRSSARARVLSTGGLGGRPLV